MNERVRGKEKRKRGAKEKKKTQVRLNKQNKAQLEQIKVSPNLEYRSASAK